MGPGSHPASYSVGNRDSDPGIKRPGRKSDHLPPSSAKVKDGGDSSTPSNVMA
jgi:hypothetical protein